VKNTGGSIDAPQHLLRIRRGIPAASALLGRAANAQRCGANIAERAARRRHDIREPCTREARPPLFRP
jgi:hypothetical protein